MTRLPRHDERGMSMSMAIFAMTMVAFLMLYVGSQALNSMYSARKKSENSVGMAAGDSAVEKIRTALQGGLIDEANDFQLDETALNLLVQEQDKTKVIPNSKAPGYASMVPVRLPDPGRLHFTVREEGSDSVGYWQVFDVLHPRFHSAAPNEVVFYVRAWATATTSDTITTKPRVFRVEYRPGWFSDFQSVTDAPFFIKDNVNVTISGPIHSNGYSVVDFLAMNDAGVTQRGIWFKDAPTCTAGAKFSTSQDTGIRVPGGKGCDSYTANAKKNARQLSLLGVQSTFQRIQNRCANGYGLVYCPTGAASYDVRLGNQSVRVNGRRYDLRNRPGSGSLVLLLDGDVVIHGALTMPSDRAGRVTIAARRRNATDRQPQVHLRGDISSVVGAQDPTKDTVGIINQGDIILDTPNYGSCMSRVNVAAISQSGSVTIPPEFVTLAPPAYRLDTLGCDGASVFYGSFAGHGQFIPSIKWPDIRGGGWTPTVGYSRPTFAYNPNLALNPAPYFPTATPWGVTKAKDANARCLVAPNAGDPRCE